MLSFLAQATCVCLSACALLPATAVFPERHFVAASVFGLAAATGVASDLGHAVSRVVFAVLCRVRSAVTPSQASVRSYTHHMFRKEKVRSS